ncbi:MAG: pyruvate synthase subunit porC [Thermoprotei archaeon]|nr:MAG: pyruvate synthase subunit porC [Thermoprotei archaeon]
MIEVRWHGRGGQGVVTSSELLALAAVKEGRYVYHAPEFGPERRGAPVRAYTRISDEPIDQHFGIYEPDAVVVIDPTLQSDVKSILYGVKRGGLLVINAESPDEELIKSSKELRLKIWNVNAYKIAMEIFGRPFYNTPMLGAFVKASKVVELESVVKAVKERFSGRGEGLIEKNIQAVKRAYEEVKEHG